MKTFDLLTTTQYGGCSAKIPQGKLTELLSELPILRDANVMVDISTHDDAGVYKIDDERALVVTTDFFPPVCSDAYEFGQIAAANSLSDIYAMGATPLLVLNLNMFPSESIPLEVLRDILKGGGDKVNEAGAFIMGGHTIEDAVPKYGLAVVGIADPKKLITNSGIRKGQKLILTKPLGVGVIMAAQRMGLVNEDIYREALESMKLLNKQGGELMIKYGVGGGTDVTGFGLLGHSLKMAEGSSCCIAIDSEAVPLFDQVEELLEMGCVPGAAFRNLKYVEKALSVENGVRMERKLALADAQTSGGLLMAVESDKAEELLMELKNTTPHSRAAIVGEVLEEGEYRVIVR